MVPHERTHDNENTSCVRSCAFSAERGRIFFAFFPKNARAKTAGTRQGALIDGVTHSRRRRRQRLRRSLVTRQGLWHARGFAIAAQKVYKRRRSD